MFIVCPFGSSLLWARLDSVEGRRYFLEGEIGWATKELGISTPRWRGVCFCVPLLRLRRGSAVVAGLTVAAGSRLTREIVTLACGVAAQLTADLIRVRFKLGAKDGTLQSRSAESTVVRGVG
jgi:hypothetical protein